MAWTWPTCRSPSCLGSVGQRNPRADPPPPVIEPPAPAPDLAPADERPEPIGEWDAWITTALAGGRVGLALQLAQARDQVGGRGTGMPVAVLEALLDGRGTRAAYDAAWNRYEAMREVLVDAAASGGEDGTARARTLLLLAGALRPALLQSQAAVDIAEALQGDLAAQLNPLVRLLSELRGSEIGAVADIAAPAGETERRARARAARVALDDWRGTAPTRTASFQGATAIWHTLVPADGAIGRVVARSPARLRAGVRDRVTGEPIDPADGE